MVMHPAWNSVARRPGPPLRRLSPRRLLLFARAFLVLGAVCAAVRLMPFRRLIRLGLARRRPSSPVDPAAAAADIVWSVQAAAARAPWRAVCIHQGIAAQWLLRRRGLEAVLRYGVRLNDAGEPLAHVWIDVDDATVMGGEAAPEFQCLATFP